MKTCTKCNIQKNIDEFGKNKNTNDGLNCWCKKCVNKQTANYRKKLVKQIGKEKILIVRRKKYAKNKDHINKLRAERQKLRRKHFTEQALKWQKNNLNKSINSKIKYRSSVKGKQKEKEYRKFYNSLPANKKRRLFLLKKRFKEDPYFKLHYTLRRHVAGALRKYLVFGSKIDKKEKSLQLLGCTIQFFKDYIEKQFDIGMNWENWGRGEGMWHIDHIRPIASFNLRVLGERSICFNYKNQRPMWSEENLKKSSNWMGKKYSINDQI